MAKNIPEKLIDFRVYANDNPDLCGVSDITLPTLKRLSDTTNVAGVLGEYESTNPLHLESMKITLNWINTIASEVVVFLKPEVIKVDCRLANKEYDGTKHTYVANRVVVRGNVISHDLGQAQKGSPYEGSTEIEVEYIKLEREGRILLEVDKINYIYKVDNVDYTADLRKALGV